jgi:hypothetical protein
MKSNKEDIQPKRKAVMTTYAAFPLAESFASSLSSHEERRADILKRLRVCCLLNFTTQ